jgi:hypothetical protein
MSWHNFCKVIAKINNSSKMKLLILCLGLATVTYIIVKMFVRFKLSLCPPPLVRYRPLRLTFTESQEKPVSVFSIFKDMFWKNDPKEAREPHNTQTTVGAIQPYSWGELPENNRVGRNDEPDDFLGKYFN